MGMKTKPGGTMVNLLSTVNPANTGHSPNAVSMLGQRRRRWANIGTSLSECPVFAGLLFPNTHCRRSSFVVYI